MGDGFATVDKRNLKSTGMSESLNPTMTTDYRLWRISTHGSFTRDLQCTIQQDSVVHNNAALHTSLLRNLALPNKAFSWRRTPTWHKAR